MVKTFTAAVHLEEDMYVARCLEIEVASQRDTIEEVSSNLREAVELYLEETSNDAGATESTPMVTSFQVEAA